MNSLSTQYTEDVHTKESLLKNLPDNPLLKAKMKIKMRKDRENQVKGNKIFHYIKEDDGANDDPLEQPLTLRQLKKSEMTSSRKNFLKLSHLEPQEDLDWSTIDIIVSLFMLFVNAGELSTSNTSKISNQPPQKTYRTFQDHWAAVGQACHNL